MPKPKGKKGKPQKKGDSAGQKHEEVVVPHTKIYVANLTGMDLTDVKFRELFEVCGKIESLDLVTTSSRVYGFVEFATVAEAEVAVEQMNGQSGMLVKFATNATAPAAAHATPPGEFEALQASDEEEPSEEEKEEEKRPARPAAKPVFAPLSRAAQNYPQPVESLQQLVQKATKTSPSEIIVYTVEDADQGSFVATVELVLTDVRTSHAGEPEQNKKEAKKSAAQAALRDPEVHRLLPPLQKEVREVAKVAKAESSESEEEASSADEADEIKEIKESKSKAVTAQSAKKQKQIEKAELRDKKLAARKAAKAKAELAEENGEEDGDDDSDDEEARDSGSDEDSESEEEGSASDDSSDDDDSDDDDVDRAALAAKKAAIKAGLAAKKGPKKPATHASVQAVAAEAKKKQKKIAAAKEKLGEVDSKNAEKLQEGRLQANFGQTKFIKP